MPERLGDSLSGLGITIPSGKECIFVWCFFLAIPQLVLDGADAYRWVEYVYIDGPMSSMGNNDVIAVADHLARLLTATQGGPCVAVSTRHVPYFNVPCNSVRKKAVRYFLRHGATYANRAFARLSTGAGHPEFFVEAFACCVPTAGSGARI